MLRATYRLFFLLFCISYYVGKLMLSGIFKPLTLDKRYTMRTQCCIQIAKQLGFDIKLEGEVPATGSMLIGNHRSYIDPVIPMIYLPCTAVMKAEVARWPVIGWSATITGILSVNRKDPESRKRVLAQMHELMQKNFSVMIFPEGTSSKAPGILPFRKGSFEMAAQGGFAVTPFVCEFANYDDAWVGDDKFIPHFYRTFSRKKIKMVLRFGKPFQNNNAEALLNTCHEWISKNSEEVLAQMLNN